MYKGVPNSTILVLFMYFTISFNSFSSTQAEVLIFYKLMFASKIFKYFDVS